MPSTNNNNFASTATRHVPKPLNLTNVNRHERTRIAQSGAPLVDSDNTLEVLSPTIAMMLDTATTPASPYISTVDTPVTAAITITPTQVALTSTTTDRRRKRQGRIFISSIDASETSSLTSFDESIYSQESAASTASSVSSSPLSSSTESDVVFAIPNFNGTKQPTSWATGPLKAGPKSKKPMLRPLIIAPPEHAIAIPFGDLQSSEYRLSVQVQHTITLPLSPADSYYQPEPPMTATQRRARRMEKLTRTLGESIPMELIRTPAPNSMGFVYPAPIDPRNNNNTIQFHPIRPTSQFSPITPPVETRRRRGFSFTRGPISLLSPIAPSRHIARHAKVLGMSAVTMHNASNVNLANAGPDVLPTVAENKGEKVDGVIRRLGRRMSHAGERVSKVFVGMKN